jgi:hypothetical protein
LLHFLHFCGHQHSNAQDVYAQAKGRGSRAGRGIATEVKIVILKRGFRFDGGDLSTSSGEWIIAKRKFLFEDRHLKNVGFCSKIDTLKGKFLFEDRHFKRKVFVRRSTH